MSTAQPFDLSLGLEGTHVLITGGCGLIGRVVVEAFLAAGCKVTVSDIHGAAPFDLQNKNISFLPGDITKDMDFLFFRAERTFGPVECCIALAGLDASVLKPTESVCDLDLAEWQRVINVNVTGTFLTCQRWLKGIRTAAKSEAKRSKLKNVNLIIVGSEAGSFGARSMPAYATGKSAVQTGLMLSLAQDAPRILPGARVNAVAPGPVDTDRFKEECGRYGDQWKYEQSEATVALGKPVPVSAVARTIVMLASDNWSGATHSQLVSVDCGKMGNVIWSKPEQQRERADSGAA